MYDAYMDCSYGGIYLPTIWQTHQTILNHQHAIMQHYQYERMMLFQKQLSASIQRHQTSYARATKQSQKFVSNFSIETILSNTDSSRTKEEKYYVPPEHFHLYEPQMLEEEASKVEPDEDGKFICYMCNKGYSRRHQLKIHFRIHTGYKPLNCGYCGKTFGDQSNMNKHKKLHAK